jgi:hypothetical protein
MRLSLLDPTGTAQRRRAAYIAQAPLKYRAVSHRRRGCRRRRIVRCPRADRRSQSPLCG